MVTRAVVSTRVGTGQRAVGRGTNTAVNVLGVRRVERRLNDIARNQRQFAPVLQQAIRALVKEVLRTTPVVSGRLYRSFRLQVQRSTITMQFRTPYANRVEQTSRRNARYFQRGLRRGITRANAVRRVMQDGSVVQYRFRNLGIRPYGYGRLEATISYTGGAGGTVIRGRR